MGMTMTIRARRVFVFSAMMTTATTMTITMRSKSKGGTWRIDSTQTWHENLDILIFMSALDEERRDTDNRADCSVCVCVNNMYGWRMCNMYCYPGVLYYAGISSCFLCMYVCTCVHVPSTLSYLQFARKSTLAPCRFCSEI